jgi:hypothetical protein
MVDAAIAAISVSLALLIMVFLLSFVANKGATLLSDGQEMCSMQVILN